MNKINYRELVRDLIKGSEIIDRKRKEIIHIVKTIIGFLMEVPIEPYQIIPIVSDHCRWSIIKVETVSKKIKHRIEIECSLERSAGDWGVACRIDTFKTELLDSRDVCAVHDCLHVLLEGVVEHFLG